jgi:hypothetical protein
MPPPVSSVHLSSWDTCSCLDAKSCLTKKSGVRQWVPTSKNGIIVPTSISMVLLRSGGREYHWMTIIVKACRDRCNDDHCRRWYYRRASSVARLSFCLISHNITVERSKTVVLKLMPSKLLIVMSRIFDRARQYDANGGIIEKMVSFFDHRWSKATTF